MEYMKMKRHWKNHRHRDPHGVLQGRVAQNHPIYVARGNEQPLLQQLMTDDPPTGGLHAYLLSMEEGQVATQPMSPCREAVAYITEEDRLREQATKSCLDAIAHPFQFFREYDEPNESFGQRLVLAVPALRSCIDALPLWPNA